MKMEVSKVTSEKIAKAKKRGWTFEEAKRLKKVSARHFRKDVKVTLRHQSIGYAVTLDGSGGLKNDGLERAYLKALEYVSIFEKLRDKGVENHEMWKYAKKEKSFYW